MNKLFLIPIVAVFLVGIIAIPTLSEQFADAKTTKKIDFTKTISSSQDPGIGHESHQLALILAPNLDSLYDGSLTYTASQPVQIVVLHQIAKGDSKGQPVWTVDEQNYYAMTLIDQKSYAGSIEFTGAALALHSPLSEPFTATVSVDGWVRGQPTEFTTQTIKVEKAPEEIKLARANVAAKIPLHKGFYNGEPLYYIITDSDDKDLAKQISEKQQWKVEYAPPLNNTAKEVVKKVYAFTDGVSGDGIFRFQPEVFSNTPAQVNDYSAIRSIVKASWKIGQNPSVLDSEEKILKAAEDGRIKLKETNLILNMPQIVWPEGEMQIREDKVVTNATPYSGGQVLEIDKKEMTVTFVAHRGWGPDGRTIYYIVTDATPTGPAKMMGAVDSPLLGNLVVNSAAVDLFQFTNGIPGSGPMGFQAGIAASAPGDSNYSPLWRIYVVEWDDPKQAHLLQTKKDIDYFSSQEKIHVDLARPMNSDHIVNCPFIDPFQ